MASFPRVGSRRFLSDVLYFRHSNRARLDNAGKYSLCVTVALQHTPPLPAKRRPGSENSELDVQELLRVLTEIPDQQSHVPCQTCQIVVQLRVGEEFPRRRGVVIQLRRGSRQIRARIAQ